MSCDHSPLFTLDFTTLFFYNLCNDYARTCQPTNQQVIEKWLRGIPPNTRGVCSVGLVRIPNHGFEPSRTQTQGVKWNDDGGTSNDDERFGPEADSALKKGKARVNSNHLVCVVRKENKPELTNEEKKLERENHPLLSTKEFRRVGVPTAFIWAAAQVDPWNLGGDGAIRRAFRKIADAVWLDGSQFVDDLVMAEVTECISDTWCASFGSAALMIIHSFFESQPALKDSDEARQEFSRAQLHGNEFLYGRESSGSDKGHIFCGHFVIMTFAQHLIAIKGAKAVIGLKYTCPTEHPYGALVLASVAVKRALTLWARKQITIKAVRQAESTGTQIQFFNDKTGNNYAQFSQNIWGEDTKSLMTSAQSLTHDDFRVITQEAQNFMKTRYGGSSSPSKKRKACDTPSLASLSVSGLLMDPSSVSSRVSSEGSSAKRARVSGTAALVGIKEELANLNSMIRTAAQQRCQHTEQLALNAATVNIPYDARIQTLAAQMLQEKENYLDDDCLVVLLNQFFADPLQARVYTRIKRDSLRMKWIKRELQKVGHIIPEKFV